MNVVVPESGVVFGPFNDNDVFLIEEWVKALGWDNEGIASVEFILRMDLSQHASVVLVEAKSSIPKESDEFFADIHEKFVCSLSLWFNAVLQRFGTGAVVDANRLDQSAVLMLPIRMILVIPGVPDHMLAPINEKMRAVFRRVRRLWGIDYSAILVLNESRATRYGLIADTGR